MPRIRLALVALALLALLAVAVNSATADDAQRPNVLVCISDDQSYPHASAYGYAAISTPAFDRVASMGVLFDNAFTPAPGCSPMRAAFLTGRHIWQIGAAGTHASSFPKKYTVYQDRLEAEGYFVGFTGKGWSPGNWKVSGWERNPAGTAFSQIKMDSPPGISNIDYAANFKAFLDKRPDGAPFSFWYGGYEPHRVFKPGIGKEHGLDPDAVTVPPFLPDTPEIREDLLDYCFEIQWFDQHLGRMLDELERRGELDNTLVIVTSDNGMAFPYAKANINEYGIHMPLAVAWPARVPGERRVKDHINLIDLTATIYEATGVAPPEEHPIAGHSILPILTSDQQGQVDESRDAIFSGRERHSSSRFNTLSYPQRGIRTEQYFYVRNFRPERWPAGAPQRYTKVTYENGTAVDGVLGPMHAGYHDIDACPSLTFLIQNRDAPRVAPLFRLAVEKRPAEQLFDIQSDPGCLINLADDSAHADAKQKLRERLMAYLRETGEPRVVGPDGGDVFETYPRYSPLRWFPQPDWAEEQPERVPEQSWLEELRPR